MKEETLSNGQEIQSSNMVNLETASKLLGEFAMARSIKRKGGGYSLVTTPEFTEACIESYISDEQIEMCFKMYPSSSEGREFEAKDYVSENILKSHGRF